jgi:hypothetical protein
MAGVHDYVVGKTTQKLRKRYSEPEVERAFAAGFAAGQAEKVFIGVCDAAMFRPSPEQFEWYLEEVKLIAANFYLNVTVLDSYCPETPKEIWIYREETPVGEWLKHPVNSPEWHKLRGQACGLPSYYIDSQYHLKIGYGERCD